MTTKTEDQVREALEKVFEKHTDEDGTMADGSTALGALMSDPDLLAAVKDIDQFVNETHEETIENWKKRAEED